MAPGHFQSHISLLNWRTRSGKMAAPFFSPRVINMNTWDDRSETRPKRGVDTVAFLAGHESTKEITKRRENEGNRKAAKTKAKIKGDTEITSSCKRADQVQLQDRARPHDSMLARYNSRRQHSETSTSFRVTLFIQQDWNDEIGSQQMSGQYL
jgi:hypothetical protein